MSAITEPRIEFARRAWPPGERLGVFAASFNPITVAHMEIVRRAAEQFALDEVLALAGRANADKACYECPLAERLEMLLLAFEGDDRVSVGVSSHAFFVDMIEAVEKTHPRLGGLHFILGFDTFERVLDRDNRYTERYHRKFGDRREALRYLLARSCLIVAGRCGAGERELRELIRGEGPEIAGRILYLDFPPDLGERSATEVRHRAGAGRPIAGLVPPPVERYINERGIYHGRGERFERQ